MYNNFYLLYVGDTTKTLKECFDNQKNVIMYPKKYGFYSVLTILRLVQRHQGVLDTSANETHTKWNS